MIRPRPSARCSTPSTGGLADDQQLVALIAEQVTALTLTNRP